MIRNMYVKIWLLITFVAIVLATNMILNRQIIKQTEAIYNKKNAINLVLRHLVDLNYTSIEIDDMQENITNENEQIKNQIISLKSKEFSLIKENHLLLLNNGLIDSAIIRSLIVLENNETTFKKYIATKSIVEWGNSNKHESLHLSSAIKEIEEHLYSNRINLMIQTQSNLLYINYIDIIQALVIVITTLVIIRMLLKENRKQKNLIVELEQLNATKDKFFSIISHDLRSPFSTILGFSDILQKEFRSYPQEQIHQYLEFIYQASKKTFDLIENLLEWSSLQTGKYQPKFKQMSINEVILDEIDLLKSTASQKYIDLSTNFKSSSNVMIDQDMMNTVIRNLISNAIKFTDVRGKIEIKTNDEINEVIISISDTGVGIDENTIGNLFKIDTKISTIGTQGEKGTGLGLSLCKELVEKNNGKIMVESEKSVGTTFCIRLPKC